MSEVLNLALVQLHSWPEVEANLDLVAECMAQLPRHCRLAVFPENVFCLGAPETVRNAARPEDDWWAQLRPVFQGFEGWAVFGGVPVREQDRIRNRALVCRRDGIHARYDKMHLFQLDPGTPAGIDEGWLYTPGDRPRTFELDGWRIALSICYDLRFPELYRACAPVDLLLCTAAFTRQTGQAHWEILLRARAVENLCFAAGVGQVGEDPETGIRFHGNSMLVTPWGNVRDRMKGDEAEVRYAALNKADIETVRRRLPALEHRRRMLSPAFTAEGP